MIDDDNDESSETAHEAMLGALLQAAYPADPTANGARVDRVMQLIQSLEVLRSVPVGVVTSKNKHFWRRRNSIGIAASIVIALVVGFQIYGPTPSAMAAIEKSLSAAGQEIARRYLLTVSFRDAERRSFAIHNDLYVQGNDRFALRHPALLPGADLWLGKTGDEAWVVPSVGPVRTGDGLALSRWLRTHDDLSTPYLHITTVLDRMSRGYRLFESKTQSIDLSDGTQVECRHVIGQLKQAAPAKLPATIELWADAETGIAQRIEARWELSASESGREKVTIEFAGQPELAEDWFQAKGHFSLPRRVVRWEAEE